MGVMTDPVAAQDALRPLRNFVSLLSGAAGDQTYAETDSVAASFPAQSFVQGPNGVSIEGKPVTVAPPGGKREGVPAWLLLVGLVGLGWALSKA